MCGLGLMKNSRAIYLLLFANSISGVSQGISMLAIPWYFTGIIHREELFGTAYFTITALSLLWGLYAGVLIDRYDRKKIFLAMNLSGLAILGTVAGLGFYMGNLPWPLVVAIFATTVFVYNIHFPNLYAFSQEITAKEDYGRVTSMLEIQGQITFTIAGAVAALLLHGVDHQVNLFGYSLTLPFSFRAWEIHEIFAVDAVTYLAAFAIIYRIKSLPMVEKKADRTQLSDRVKAGFKFLNSNRLLLHFGNAALLVFLTVLIFGTYLQPIYVHSILHQGGDVYGLSEMAFSLGAVVAGFLTTRIFAEKNAVWGIVILSSVSGLMYFTIAGKATVPVFFAANFIIGACNAAIRIQRVTFLFHHIPNYVIGRANSIFFVFNVFLRLCLIAAFTIPFFHRGKNVLYAICVLAIICFAGAAILILQRKKLQQVSTVASSI